MSVFALLLTSFVLVTVTYLYYRNSVMSPENFLAAGRNTGGIIGAITILATWSAAPAILIPAQLGYARGLSTALWFTIPNALTLVVFGVISVQIRKRLPKGYTIAELFGDRTDRIYQSVTFLTLAKSFVALSMSVVGGAAFLTYFSDLPRFQSVILILGTILAYSLISGLDASIFTDVLQTLAFGVLYIVFVPWSISAGNGITLVIDSLGRGALSQMFSGANIEYGLILAILLFTSPIVSQYIWQRAYAIKEEKLMRAFTLAGFGFFFIPAGMAVLGLVAAAGGGSLETPVLASYVAMDQVLPSSASLVIFLLLLTTLLSAADSALVACGSIVGVDVVGKYIDPDIDKTRVSRYAMVGVSALVALAAMSPLNTLDWVMLNAPIGAVLSVPILVYLYFPDVPDDTYTTVALVVGSLVAFPIYIYGTLEGNNSLRLAGLIGALLFSAMLVFVVPSVQQSTNVSSAD